MFIAYSINTTTGGDTCRSVYTVSDKHLRHGGSGYETTHVLVMPGILSELRATITRNNRLTVSTHSANPVSHHRWADRLAPLHKIADYFPLRLILKIGLILFSSENNYSTIGKMTERLQCHPGKSDGHVFCCPEFCYRF